MVEKESSGHSRKTWMIIAIVLAMLLVAVLAVKLYSQAPLGDALVGVWQGTVTGKPGTFQVYFTIEKKGESEFTAKVDIPAQNARNIPVTEVRWTPPDLILDLSSYGIVFEGRMAEDGTAIIGLFKVGPENLTLLLSRTASVPPLHRPQDPKKPYPYEETEVMFRNEGAKINLSGTLTVPSRMGPFRAVVLISGSGPQDRDSTLAGHRPFLVLADFLTRQGIAVLRFDDRGCGQSQGDFHKATTADFATDARAAWDFLRKQPGIDQRRVGLIGHSEGALIAPMVAAANREVAFLVLLSGTGIPGDRLAVMQVEAMARSRGASLGAVQKESAMIADLLEVFRKQDDAQRAEEEMIRIAIAHLVGMNEAEKKELNESEESMAQDIKVWIADYTWNRFFMLHDPAVVLRQVVSPVLALNGDKDTQVPADVNLQAIGRVLKKAGNKKVEIVKLPGLNHLFQTARTGHPREYGKIEETISPAVMQRISDWILEIK